MRSLGALWLVLLALTARPALAQARVSRCWAACERNVSDPRLRASACGACLTSPDQGAAWLSRLPELPPRLLEDQDWEVRWAALLAEAKKSKGTAAHQLGLWISHVHAQGKGEDLQRACLTAVHAAGAIKSSLTALLSADPKAAQLCLARESALRDALWIDLYSEGAPTRREALTHLARAFERPPARVVLDAMPTHAAAFDELVLETLASWSLEADVSPAASLMTAATPADVESMNRVLAVYARQRDAAKPLLSSPQDPVRRQALSRLAELAPITEAELLGALGDSVPSHRLLAARGLARGESRSLAEMTAARISGEKPATLAQQRALLELVGDTHEKDCAPVLVGLWRRRTGSAELHQRALVVASSCSWVETQRDVSQALGSNSVLERAAAVAALGFTPRNEQLSERLLRASDSAEGPMRAAACQAIGQQRWRGGTARMTALAGDPEPEVRAAALRALVALDAPGLEAKLGTALEKDAAPLVRATAAELLARFTGPRAISALSAASRNDTDANVKLVAAQSLRKLAPGSLPP